MLGPSLPPDAALHPADVFFGPHVAPDVPE